MHTDVTSLVRPRAVAVIGASARRMTQGNVVIGNLKDWGYRGRILPVHPEAASIDGFGALNSVAALPPDTDVAIVAIPAAQVGGVLGELEQSAVRSAIVFTAGFTAEQDHTLRERTRTSRLIVHGPNCMGLVNFSDSVPLYPSRPSIRLRPGRVAIVAQSGSAAISLMNSTVVGLSKVVTVGSEYRVSAADYIRWLAEDDATAAIGVVAESIKDPVAFALAAEAVHAAGKALVVLKVGRSATGMAATQAHTGALAGERDAFDDFFATTGIATAGDYDELVAALECAATVRRRAGAGKIGIIGISGGQTALACDVAEDAGLALASFSAETTARLLRALPGVSGQNPVDAGATVDPGSRNIGAALRDILDDSDVAVVAALQDSQESLNPATLRNSYDAVFAAYAEAARGAAKPVAVISPTGEGVVPEVRALLADAGVPLLRGLRPGLRAVASLGLGRPGPAGAWAQARHTGRSPFHPRAAEWRRTLAGRPGALDPATAFGLLRDYGLPVVKSIVVRDAEEAVRRAGEIGFPMVVKVASASIQHRSDVGGVVLEVTDEASLRAAIGRIVGNVAAARPDAIIDGFEVQEQLVDGVEAMAGFTAAPPFGPLVVVGSGGTLVELLGDRAVGLAPFDAARARQMLETTRLARRLGGYRNLMPATDPGPLAGVAARLSELASDLDGVMLACDLNPVLVRKGAGEVRIVDALCLCA
ncbi:MAG: acetate--CoA ligase family protein [Rhodobacteraceae bacterium]|nr:acetate--CoA ligase family protein [Paracoccaceae bacterium]